MKKILSFLLVTVFTITLSSCGDDNNFNLSEEEILEHAKATLHDRLAYMHDLSANNEYFNVSGNFLLPLSVPRATVSWVSNNDEVIRIANTEAVVYRDIVLPGLVTSHEITLTARITIIGTNTYTTHTFDMVVSDQEIDYNAIVPLSILDQSPTTRSNIMVLARVLAKGEFIAVNNNCRYIVIGDGTSNAIVRAAMNAHADREWMANELEIGDPVLVSGSVVMSTGGIQGNTQVPTIEVSNLSTQNNIIVLEEDQKDNIVELIDDENIPSFTSALPRIELTLGEPEDNVASLDDNGHEAEDIHANFHRYLGRQFKFNYATFQGNSTGGSFNTNNVTFANFDGFTFSVNSTNERLQSNGYTTFTAFLVGRQGTELRFSIVNIINFIAGEEIELLELSVTEVMSIEDGGRKHLGQELITQGRIVGIAYTLTHETATTRNSQRYIIITDGNTNAFVRLAPRTGQTASIDRQMRWMYDTLSIGDFIQVEGRLIHSVGDNTNLGSGSATAALNNTTPEIRIEKDIEEAVEILNINEVNEEKFQLNDTQTLSDIEAATITVTMEDFEGESNVWNNLDLQARINPYSGLRIRFENVSPSLNTADAMDGAQNFFVGLPGGFDMQIHRTPFTFDSDETYSFYAFFTRRVFVSGANNNLLVFSTITMITNA